MAQIHFNHIFIGAPVNHAVSAWTHPADHQSVDLAKPAYWQHLARTLERGCFDGIFFADTFSVPDDHAEETIAYGVCPRIDPFMLIPLMADVTKHLGFAVTLSTVGTPPHLAVRRIGTIDNLSGGRVAWNVVTSYLESDFKAVGLERPLHDARYDQADEYIEICYRLWDAFPREAMVKDRARGVYIDTSKIRKVEYKGKYYNCEAWPVMVCSPQGRPLIFQAGASGRGMQYAATHADAVYALQPPAAMNGYVAKVREAMALQGRADPKVYFGIQPYVGSTEEEARSKLRDLEDKVPLGAALSRLGGLLGAQFKEEDLDEPFQPRNSQASQGWVAAVQRWDSTRPPTVREMALHVAISPLTPQIVGTPEQVADRIEAWWRDTGCYGFAISPHVTPGSTEDFVDQVVPILQKRGLMRTEYAGTTYRENLEQN